MTIDNEEVESRANHNKKPSKLKKKRKSPLVTSLNSRTNPANANPKTRQEASGINLSVGEGKNTSIRTGSSNAAGDGDGGGDGDTRKNPLLQFVAAKKKSNSNNFSATCSTYNNNNSTKESNERQNIKKDDGGKTETNQGISNQKFMRKTQTDRDKNASLKTNYKSDENENKNINNKTSVRNELHSNIDKNDDNDEEVKIIGITGGNNENHQLQSPVEILNLQSSSLASTSTAIFNGLSSQEQQHLQQYYDKSYFAAHVDSYIQSSYENIHKWKENNDEKNKGNPGLSTIVASSLSCSFYNHPILGKIQLKQEKKKSYQTSTRDTSNSANTFLSFPQSRKHTLNDIAQAKRRASSYILGSSIPSTLLSFPPSQKRRRKYKNDSSSCSKNEFSSIEKTNFIIPMSSKGRLKIICHQGATVREKFDINEDDNEQLIKLSKNDEREFVDAKWLSSTYSHTDDNLQTSTYDEEESNITGVMRYKIRLEMNDVINASPKKTSVVKNSDMEEDLYGWISDRSRLKKNPYWIAIVLNIM